MASSSSTERAPDCSRRGSFRSSTDQGFVPSRWVDTKMRKVTDCGCVTLRLVLHPGQLRLPKPKTTISDAIEFEQLGIDGKAAGGRQPFALAVHQIEFDHGTRDVPRSILAANQVVTPVMVERVRLDQPSVGAAQPFAPVELIVGADARDRSGQVLGIPAVERRRRLFPKC